MDKLSGISCNLETHLNNSSLHFMMAKRDRLESGAVLAEGCAVGVSLHYMLALFVLGIFCFSIVRVNTYFSSSIGPLRGSTRPYFLLRIEIS
jgi:hypothetical protein